MWKSLEEGIPGNWTRTLRAMERAFHWDDGVASAPVAQGFQEGAAADGSTPGGVGPGSVKVSEQSEVRPFDPVYLGF